VTVFDTRKPTGGVFRPDNVAKPVKGDSRCAERLQIAVERWMPVVVWTTFLPRGTGPARFGSPALLR
jgi:hypothetical protein